MTETNSSLDVEIPGNAAPESNPSPPVRTSRFSPAVRLGLLVLVVFLVIGFALFRGSGSVLEPASSLQSGGNIDATPGGPVQAESRRYQQLLEELNARESAAAAEEGRTFLQTPEIILEDIDPEEEPNSVAQERVIVSEPEETPVFEPVSTGRPDAVVPEVPGVVRSEPERVASKVTAESNPWTAAMIAQMGNVPNGPGVASLTVTSTGWTRPENEAGVERPAVAEESPAIDAGQASAVDRETVIPAGTLLYGETVTSVSSDEPGAPVLVTVTAGELMGARLVGSFAVAEGSRALLVSFASMTLPDGRSMPVSAVAVDGISAEAAVASDVDGRYLQRYGAVLATSFLAGAAQALGEPASELRVTDGGLEVVSRARSTERQALYAGLGRAVNLVASDLQAAAPRGPKITLQDGWPLAVLFLEPVVDEGLPHE